MGKSSVQAPHKEHKQQISTGKDAPHPMSLGNCKLDSATYLLGKFKSANIKY